MVISLQFSKSLEQVGKFVLESLPVLDITNSSEILNRRVSKERGMELLDNVDSVAAFFFYVCRLATNHPKMGSLRLLGPQRIQSGCTSNGLVRGVRDNGYLSSSVNLKFDRCTTDG